MRLGGTTRRICGVLLVIALALAGTCRADVHFGPDPAAPGAQKIVPEPESRKPLAPNSSPSAATRRTPSAPAVSPAGLGSAQTIGALAIVVGAILGVAALVRRLARTQGGLMAALGPGGRAPCGVLEVLGRYPVSRGTTLVLLKLDRRVLLVCQSSSGKISGGAMSTLCEITDPEEVASILVKAGEEEGRAAAKKFQSLLSNYDAKTESAIVRAAPVVHRPRTGVSAMRERLTSLRGKEFAA